MDKQKKRMLYLIKAYGYYTLCAIRDIGASYKCWRVNQKSCVMFNQMIYNIEYTAEMFKQYLEFREYYKSYNKYLKKR